ncbi:hypothetical protein [Flavobacterium sp.]|uniref:hypothetical protein n=1 Tax=Flavobacterium sp. TaxID=239 RepID=UPI003752469B
MKKSIITLKEKRFLIIWLGICGFACFMNAAKVGGKIDFGNGRYQYLFFYNPRLTGDTYNEDFYPFTEFIVDNSARYPSENFSQYFIDDGTYIRFNGIFNSFDLPEFIFYSILGLCIVFTPKVWK